MVKKICGITLALVVALGVFSPMNAYAATELKDSVGSTATDTTVGSDATQGQTTKYEESEITTTTHNSSNSVTVYATKSSWAKVSIPKTLILGPSATDDTKYECTFKVEIEGDIAGAQSITVTPSIASQLVESDGKTSTTNSTITINGANSITVGANDLLNGAVYTATGKIVTTDVTAGVWSAKINFGVVINYN